MAYTFLLTRPTIHKQVERGGSNRLTSTLVEARFSKVKKTKSKNFSVGVVAKPLYKE